jgi:hypothetical protein
MTTHSWSRLFCTVYCILSALQYKCPHLSLCLPLFLPFLFAELRAETLRCKPEALGALMADHTQLDWRPVLPLLALPCLNVVGGCRYAMLTDGHLCYAQAQMASSGDVLCCAVLCCVVVCTLRRAVIISSKWPKLLPCAVLKHC